MKRSWTRIAKRAAHTTDIGLGVRLQEVIDVRMELEAVEIENIFGHRTRVQGEVFVPHRSVNYKQTNQIIS